MGFDILSYAMGLKTGKSGNESAGTEEMNLLLDDINGEIIGETLYHVTFIGADGSELCVVPVYDNYDCQNPVLNGTIERPTKPSTEYLNFTFSGWSETEGGEASYSALKNITGNKTVYAAFTESTRYYTVRFFDGSKLLKTMQTEFGGSLEYNYSKIGHTFEGWQPEPLNITEDMDCYAQMIESNFSSNSWETIAEISASGNASQHYSIGDEREITLNYSDGTSEKVILQIAGFGVDDINSSQKAGISIIAKNALKTPKVWNTVEKPTILTGANAYTAEGFIGSELKTYLDTVVYNALPGDLTSRIKTVQKHYNYYTGVNSDAEAFLYMALFVPSMYEITGIASYSDENGFRYSGLYNSESKRIATLYDTGEAVPWWTTNVNGGYSVYVISKTGATGNSYSAANAGAHVVFGFCI